MDTASPSSARIVSQSQANSGEYNTGFFGHTFTLAGKAPTFGWFSHNTRLDHEYRGVHYPLATGEGHRP